MTIPFVKRTWFSPRPTCRVSNGSPVESSPFCPTRCPAGLAEGTWESPRNEAKGECGHEWTHQRDRQMVDRRQASDPRRTSGRFFCEDITRGPPLSPPPLHGPRVSTKNSQHRLDRRSLESKTKHKQTQEKAKYGKVGSTVNKKTVPLQITSYTWHDTQITSPGET